MISNQTGPGWLRKTKYKDRALFEALTNSCTFTFCHSRPFQAYNMFLSVQAAENVKQYLAGVGSRGLITRNAGLAVTKIRLDKPPDST